MNYLTITDIKQAGSNIELSELVSYLKDRLIVSGVECVFKIKNNQIAIITEKKKLFWSNKPNIIKLKEGDSRIKKNGRDFLESERLNEKQFKTLIESFSTHLDQIAISCSIKLYPSKDDLNNFIVIRDTLCNNYISGWPKPASFPIERI